ncbi:hypothetical protein ABZ957_13380 [Streptomyces sp. NPDC046316]|uniref:hypothetical protein n=1 Tax=Streptomyces sp. NPDC046316 TaxID=3154494 RepID=UPI003402E0C8
MGFWDRIRRGGAQAPAAPAPSDTAAVEPGPAAAPPAPAGRPGWDGGWREVAPPSVTIARSPLGVSDGLRFRSGLASWQNPTLTSGLGHGLVPSAPAGLIHGVARPTGAPRATTVEGGGPLLLRAVRPDAEPDPDAGADAGSDAGPATGSGTTSQDPGQAVQRRTGTTAPAAVPARSPGRPEAVDPLVVPRSAGSGSAASPGTPASSASPRRTTPAPGGSGEERPHGQRARAGRGLRSDGRADGVPPDDGRERGRRFRRRTSVGTGRRRAGPPAGRVPAHGKRARCGPGPRAPEAVRHPGDDRGTQGQGYARESGSARELRELRGGQGAGCGRERVGAHRLGYADGLGCARRLGYAQHVGCAR